MRGERGKVLPCFGRERSGTGVAGCQRAPGKGPTFYIDKKSTGAPRGAQTPGVSPRPLLGRGTNDKKKPHKQVPAAPGRHPMGRQRLRPPATAR